MVLYVDETECPEYFIVTGLLVNSKEDVTLAFKRFRKYAKNISISAKKKADLFAEFKSTFMDNHYQKAKVVMLEELNQFEHCIIFSTYIKKSSSFTQKEKERAYINMISKIVSSIANNIEIYFDGFNIPNFEKNIVKKLLSFSNVVIANATNSQDEPGIKFADNLCSVMRLHKTNMDKHIFYSIVEKYVQEV